jgi:hypothetical protein
MASAFYEPFLEQIQQGLDLATTDLKLIFVDDADYTFDVTDEFVSDLGAGLGPESNLLTSKTFTNGVFDAADALFPGAAGDEMEAVVVATHTGNPATERVCAYLDDLTVILNGGDVNVIWHASGIWKL